MPSVLSKSRDWGIYQVVACADHSIGLNYVLALLFFGLLHNHALHHLFPTIDHSRLMGLRKELIETCKEFNVPYHPNKAIDLYEGMVHKMIA